MAIFSSKETWIDLLEKTLSSYGKPVVDTVLEIGSHPIDSLKHAIPTALEFVQDHPYAFVASAIGSFALYKIYSNRGLGFSLGRVWAGADTFLGGFSAEVHIGHKGDTAYELSKLSTRVTTLSGNVSALSDSQSRTNTTLNTYHSRVDGMGRALATVGSQVDGVHEVVVRKRSMSVQ
jgi:hypothetical protein